jgi:hypothetical protein
VRDALLSAITSLEPLLPARRGHPIPTCGGCREVPLTDCAACGAPAVVTTEAGAWRDRDGSEASHSAPWCRRCFATLMAVRAPYPPLIATARSAEGARLLSECERHAGGVTHRAADAMP